MFQCFFFQTLCVGITAEGCCSCSFMKSSPKDVLLCQEGCRVLGCRHRWPCFELTAPLLQSYTTVLVVTKRPGTGEAAGPKPKLPSPDPGGRKCARAPQLAASPGPALNGLEELKLHLCLLIAKQKKFWASMCRPGLSLPARCSTAWLLPEATSTAL